MKIITGMLLLFSCKVLFSQGHIDHIKNQSYLKLKGNVDCNKSLGDNLSERICANLAYQKSDSLLTLIYDSLLVKTKELPNKNLTQKSVNMQTIWRAYRDEHCGIIYDTFEGCGGCAQQAISFLYCLTELTQHRTRELRMLFNDINKQE
jgi:uncharacterized protein YecT (DUF1311 family)